MDRIRAAQHFFAHVDKEVSPTGISGYQTLCYSRSLLSEEDVLDLEGRLTYHKAGCIKKLFFPLSDSWYVVSRIVNIEETDTLGRGGRYFAHSVLVTVDDFRRMGANPFDLFDSVKFIESIDDAMSGNDFASGEAIPVEIRPRSSICENNKAGTLNLNVWRNVAQIAIHADDMAEARSVAVFLGNSTQMEKLLRRVFIFLPTALVEKCSFDTCFEGCSFASLYFWGVSLERAPFNPNYYHINAENGTMTGGPELGDNQPSYERWLLLMLKEGRRDEVPEKKEDAFEICEFLDGKNGQKFDVERYSAGLVRTAVVANRKNVLKRVEQKLNEVMPISLAFRLKETIVSILEPKALIKKLQGSFRRSELSQWLFESYRKMKFETPDADEWAALSSWLDGRSPVMLRFVAACWQYKRNGDRQQLSGLLVIMDDAVYRSTVRFALKNRLAEPYHLFISGRGEALLSEAEVDPKQVLPLVQEIIDAGEYGCLGRLSGRLQFLQKAEVRRLRKLTDRKETRDGIPPVFIKALDEAWEKYTFIKSYIYCHRKKRKP